MNEIVLLLTYKNIRKPPPPKLHSCLYLKWEGDLSAVNLYWDWTSLDLG